MNKPICSAANTLSDDELKALEVITASRWMLENEQIKHIDPADVVMWDVGTQRLIGPDRDKS